MLFLGVVVLIGIDVFILLIYNAVAGAQGKLEAMRVEHLENPEDRIGVR